MNFFLLILSVFLSGNLTNRLDEEVNPVAITWLTWEEAIALNKETPKKILIDVYTDWCGWCKRMDKDTFSDPKIAELINKHFYAVKLDAEQKGEVIYNNHTFVFRPDYGRKGAHELAVSLLDGRMGYPSFVFLDEAENRITISPGYKNVESMEMELNYILGNHYLEKTFDAYKNDQ